MPMNGWYSARRCLTKWEQQRVQCVVRGQLESCPIGAGTRTSRQTLVNPSSYQLSHSRHLVLLQTCSDWWWFTQRRRKEQDVALQSFNYIMTHLNMCQWCKAHGVGSGRQQDWMRHVTNQLIRPGIEPSCCEATAPTTAPPRRPPTPASTRGCNCI